LSVSTIFNNDDVNFSTLKPIQDDNIFGKILIIDQKTHKYEYYAKGFRNILGLFADKDIILATDNGPKGGDEINKVIKNQNYGWPISSYGEKYFKKYEDSSINYKKNHEDNDFQEPIFAFVPSIGISQIIRLPNNFSEQWHDNFLIATLNDKHLLRVKFDNNFSKILYIEKIFINERIRDLKYSKKNNFIILALESSGSFLKNISSS
jgi:glucose/arabinose dehydrogenase